MVETLKHLLMPFNWERGHSGRIHGLDVFRGFAMFMMLCHNVLLYISASEVAHTLYGNIVYYIADTGTPVFMIYLGLYQVYARPVSTRLVIMRGLKLFILGYVLNVLRFLPIYIGVMRGSLDINNFAPYSLLDLLLKIDILQFAGLILIIIPLLYKYLVRPIYWLLIGAVSFAVSPFLIHVYSGNTYINMILDFFWGTSSYVDFPLFPWISYTMVGMVLGVLFLKIKDFDRIDLNLALLGGLLFIIGNILVYFQVTRVFLETYISSYYVVTELEQLILNTGFLMLWQSLYFWLYKLVPNNFILRTFRFWSRNITTYYFIFWTVVGWISAIYFQNFRQQDVWETAVANVIVLLLTHVILLFIYRLKASKSKGKYSSLPPRESQG